MDITFSKVELTFSKVVLIVPAGLLNVEFRAVPRLNVEFKGGLGTWAKKD